MNNKTKTIFSYIIPPLILLSLWHIVTAFKIVSPIFLPKPHEVVSIFFEAAKDRTIFTDLLLTLYRTFVGFGLAIIIGVPVGLLMGYSKRIYTSLEFLVEFFRSIPATSLFPLFLLIFGIGDNAKISLAAWDAGLVIVINSMYGVHAGKELRLKAAKIMKVKEFQLFRRVIFPEALPHIFTGLRIGLSFALVITVITEMFIGTSHGLGRRIIDAQLAYNVDDMYMTILLTGIIGFILNKTLMRLEKNIIHWKGK